MYVQTTYHHAGYENVTLFYTDMERRIVTSRFDCASYKQHLLTGLSEVNNLQSSHCASSTISIDSQFESRFG